ncbi:tRNA dimethylallyltransferase [compost metagenome]
MQFDEQEIDEEYRKYLYELANTHSNEYVHDILRKLDENAANNIHPNNLKRVIRAIEYSKYLNKTKSEHMKSEQERIKEINNNYEFKVYGIDIKRELLYSRIDKRVDQMISDGIVSEAKMVYNKKLNKDITCMQTIGYKEFFGYFENTQTIEECIEVLKKETRRYAKRQMTWFKKMPQIKWLDGLKTKEELCVEILENINE